MTYRCMRAGCPREQIGPLVAAATAHAPAQLVALLMRRADSSLACVRCGACVQLPANAAHVIVPPAAA